MTGGAGARIGIIVAAYNAEPFLAETLRSVRDQTLGDWSCVVIDDGSTDRTAAIAAEAAAEDDRFQVVRQENTGVSAARNAGMRSFGPAVDSYLFLDSDDILLPHALQTLRAALDRHPDVLGVYGVAEYIDVAGNPIRPGAHPRIQADRRRVRRFRLHRIAPEEPSTFSTLVVSGTIWPSAVALFRRAAVDRVGGFDPAISYAEDWDLYIRMCRHGDLVPIDEHIVWYRQHPNNLTKRRREFEYHLILVRWKTWADPANSPAQRREATRAWRRLFAAWVYHALSSAVEAARDREPGRALAALGAALRFTLIVLRGPRAPDDRLATLVTDFVASRRHRLKAAESSGTRQFAPRELR